MGSERRSWWKPSALWANRGPWSRKAGEKEATSQTPEKSASCKLFLINGIKLLTKYLGLSGYFKEFMVSFLTKDPMRLAKAFKDCNELTKLVAESLSESVFMMLQNNNGMKGQGYTFIRNALGDAITDNRFVVTLENSLGKIVCSAYKDMSGKASKVVDKLIPGVEGLTSQITK